MIADDGFFFGLGAFETIAVERGVPQFLPWHMERMQSASEFLNLPFTRTQIEREIEKALRALGANDNRTALKVTVTQENILCTCRKNVYGEQDYRRGFRTVFSKVQRNETSPLTYYKTLNYGDCILEKRNAKQQGFDEPIFLNSRGELAEGSTSNIFFLKGTLLVAPPLSCGMLPGIIRRYIYQTYSVREEIVTPDTISDFDEMFLTNSLLGIMPVQSLGNHTFYSVNRSLALCKQLYRTTNTF